MGVGHYGLNKTNRYGFNEDSKNILKPFNEKGGVQIINTSDDVQKIAKGMMGNTLITKQTGKKGKYVNRIFVEEVSFSLQQVNAVHR